MFALPGQISLSSPFADEWIGFLFYPFTYGITLQKACALYVHFNPKAPFAEAQRPVSRSDAAVKTQTSWLQRLTNAPQAAAVSVSAYCSGFLFSLCFHSQETSYSLTRSAIHLKESLLHYILHF